MSSTDQSDHNKNDGLINIAGVGEHIALSENNEEAWIDVIQKMDEVYADHVRYQLELEQKNAELEDAQAFIDSVLSSMTDVLIVCDTRGKIQQANAAYKKLSNFQDDDILGKDLQSIFASQSAKTAATLTTKIRDHERIEDQELFLVDSNGKESLFSMNCSARYDHEGRFVGIVLIGRHLGELRRAYKDLDKAHQKLRNTQQQLVFAEKMTALGRLVAGVAHELNNPISFVFGNMHALRRYGERITKYLKAIDGGTDSVELVKMRQDLKIDRIVTDINPLVDGTLEGAERVSEIVQELRRFSSVQKETQEPFNIVRVIRTAGHWVSKSVTSKHNFIYDMPERLEITSRRGPVHQIMVNLLQNALDVVDGQDNAKITIRTIETDHLVEIHVIDNGPGIKDSAIDQIFEPFFTTKPLGQGTGLGLYISYGLAEELGGKITASNHKKGGAEFILSLPKIETAHE